MDDFDLNVLIVGSNWKWKDIEKITGYKPITDYWEQFTEAEKVGEPKIRLLFGKLFRDKEIKKLTELSMVLNWKMFDYSETNLKLSLVYRDLWAIIDSWCMDNLKDDDLSYYLSTTD